MDEIVRSASSLVDAAVMLGGVLVAPEHTVMQRLAERRIAPQVITAFDIQPFNNGWRYPTPRGAYRWKNADSKADPKYKWLDGKDDFYHVQDIASAIYNAGGACWFVSGEADVWAMQSAGIAHVISGYTEASVSKELPAYLESMGVTVLYIAPDLDQTGAGFAGKVARVLQESSIELDARQLPKELGDKGDIGKAWAIYTRRQTFERWLLGLPRFIPEPEPKPEPKALQVDAAIIPAGYRQLIADLLHATEYQGDGFTKKNVRCPFHNDGKHADASLHQEKGLYCHVCGRWFTWNETGIKAGAGSLRTWRMANTYALSTELREALIRDNKTNLARLLDAVAFKGWKAGREFTRKDAVTVCIDLLTAWTIRQALESLCGFFPSFSITSSMKEKTLINSKQTRPPKVYKLPELSELAGKLQVKQIHFDEIPAQKIKHAADYRAEVYAALPRRKAGQYARKTLTERIAVSARTGQSYDKRANLIVTPNIERRQLKPDEIADLPDKVYKNRKYNLWLEDENCKKYRPDKESIKRIAENGGGKVYRVIQSANSYKAG
ncbi:MAG: hypothetical protein IT310_15310 [Anaerolineales bacterium]|nr:hypothetical protein [Anaerolineales bacterium]